MKATSRSRRCMACVASARPRLRRPMRNGIAATIGHVVDQGADRATRCALSYRRPRCNSAVPPDPEWRAGACAVMERACASGRWAAAHLRQRDRRRRAAAYLPARGGAARRLCHLERACLARHCAAGGDPAVAEGNRGRPSDRSDRARPGAEGRGRSTVARRCGGTARARAGGRLLRARAGHFPCGLCEAFCSDACGSPLRRCAPRARASITSGRTVAKTFAGLRSTRRQSSHPRQSRSSCCALLAPEPDPADPVLRGREKLGEPLSSALEGDGLDEAIAALRAFALIDRRPRSMSGIRSLPRIASACIAW